MIDKGLSHWAFDIISQNIIEPSTMNFLLTDDDSVDSNEL